jgi:hypothetical protein
MIAPSADQARSIEPSSWFALAAGVADKLWSVADLAEMIDGTLPKPGPRDPYNKPEL